MKKRRIYQQPGIHIVEAVEAVAMLNANSGKATIGDLDYGGNLGDNTSGNGTIGDLNWEDLGGNASGGAKESTGIFDDEPLFETRHNKEWDE